MVKPEAAARQQIDAALEAAGWDVQDAHAVNLAAGCGVAIREYPLKTGHGFADYMLYVNGLAVGVVEAKPEGTTLTGVEVQSEKYGAGLPGDIPAPVRPLPFLYESTGVETRFTNQLDPEPRSRHVFGFHRPETLAHWIDPKVVLAPTSGLKAAEGRVPYASTLRRLLQNLPPIPSEGLWPAQLTAVENLEQSFAEDRPRALIQMATGSGKTFTAITSIYRLIKFAGARRVLFLVDRANLGRQALKEFQQYTTPDDGRKFTELYNVQRLTTNRIDPVARVCITTIQRLYSMLTGEPDLDEELEEGSQYDTGADLVREPVPVVYNAAIPVETFDFVFTDECHRSIYNLWRQVLEYFDAHIVGLTATPSKQTFGFFNQNLVIEYNHGQAVADGVNVDFDVYRIRTEITEAGSTVEAGLFVDRRDRETRRVRWEKLDEDLTYGGTELDRSVVATDQIRTVVRTFRDRLFTDIFPGRTEVPKTLIYAKDDSHADDIVQIVREEFGKGNEFCQKITYRAGTVRIVTKTTDDDGNEVEEVTYKSSGLRAEDLLSSFRNAYFPRIVVTVDMLATGTDIRPLEVVMFMRAVKSRTFFEQMKGRGVRVVDTAELRAVTPDAASKTHFVIVDCVGLCEENLTDSQPLERQPTIPFHKLLQAVAFGSTDPDVISSLAGRLARLDRQLGAPERLALERDGGMSLKAITTHLVEALDPDRQAGAARTAAGLPEDAEPSPERVEEAARRLLREAAAPLAGNPSLRQRLVDLKQHFEQTIDTVSRDAVLEAAFSPAARERANELVVSFEQFIREHKDEITALQVLYSRPYRERLRPVAIRELADVIEAPPRSWTPEQLWRAYEALDQSKVRGSAGRVLTDVVALVRFALRQDDELVPFPDRVEERFQQWLAQQESARRRFTEEQLRWLEDIRDHIAANFQIEADDFQYVPFAQRGGLGKAHQVFGEDLGKLLDELNEVLVA
ncbi:MAG: type I restriction-modification enzyme R subunit C-terminal domain-containing protein [Dehalococcoidia bacterium]|nr:type I restriction-modification enzyme R subunit C-terminal domain-containing protein [Dehalococcoidia bacterium]